MILEENRPMMGTDSPQEADHPMMGVNISLPEEDHPMRDIGEVNLDMNPFEEMIAEVMITKIAEAMIAEVTVEITEMVAVIDLMVEVHIPALKDMVQITGMDIEIDLPSVVIQLKGHQCNLKIDKKLTQYFITLRVSRHLISPTLRKTQIRQTQNANYLLI